MFIKLTELIKGEYSWEYSGENDIYVNALKIEYMMRVDCTTIIGIGLKIFEVIETPEEILEMIGRIENERNRNGNY